MSDSRAGIFESAILARHLYIVPFVLVILALLPRLLLHPVLAERSAFVLFTLAIMASAWYGGLKSGLLATALSATIGGYFVLRPFENLAGEDLIDLLEVVLFSITGVGVSWMAEQLRIARVRAESSERQARAEHQRIMDILDGTSDAFEALDADFRFEYLNSAAERFLGRTKAELSGKRIFDEFPELFDPDLEARLGRAVVDGGIAHFEHYFAARQRWFELNVYP